MPATNKKSFTIFAFVLLSLTPLNSSLPHPFFEDEYYQDKANFFLTSNVNRAVLFAFQDELTKVRDNIRQMFEGNLDMLKAQPLIEEALDQIPYSLLSLRSSVCKLGSMIEEIFLEAREEVLKSRYQTRRFDKERRPFERLSDSQYRELISICYTDDEYVVAQLEETQVFINALIACPQPRNPVRGPLVQSQYPVLVPYRQAHQTIRSRL